MAQIFASERKSVPAPARRTKPADAHPIRQNAQTPAPGHDLSGLQTRADGSAVVAQLARWGQAAAQRQEQDEGAGTSGAQGLPADLRTGMEQLSGTDMSAVKVHYNSSRPASVNAHAYAQGSDIHLAPGQERHLPHEAWHTVQQAQGRVRPTHEVQGVAINDDAALEQEADQMGARAVAQARSLSALPDPQEPDSS
ncbi:MAG: DUF4157 domain-containing protein [Pseudomonadota bacterium]